MGKNTRWRCLWLVLVLCATALVAMPIQGRPTSFSFLRPYNGENVDTSTPTFEKSADGASPRVEIYVERIVAEKSAESEEEKQ